MLTPNDPGYSAVTWPYLQAALPNAWDLTTGQTSVVVAVLDTGIDYAHTDLPALTAGYDFVNNDSNPADDQGHGTSVTGAFGAKINNGVAAAGVCPGCTVMPVKVLNSAGIGADANIASGIVWAADKGARVINLSLGGTGYTAVLQDAVTYAISRGVVIIAAAGNDGLTTKLYPASFDGVIGVAATQSNNTLDTFSTRGQHLELAAPGCLQTTLMGGGLGEVCGTSIASPIVAGVVGLMLSRNPALNRVQVEGVLTGTASGSSVLDVKFGLLDAYKAVNLAGSMPAVPVNTALPAISGTLNEGETLTAATGSWANSPTSFAYAWERCNAAGVTCAKIAGATSSTYQLLGADVGSKLRVIVTATNAGGNTSATSALTGLVTGNVPLPGSNVDLYATISSSTSAPAVGSDVVYRIAVGTRPSTAAASRVKLAFTMPTGLTYVEAKPSRGTCTTAGQTVTCDLGYFSPPAQAEVSVTAKVGMAGMQTVVAEVTPTPEDAKPGDNMITQSVTVPGPPSPAPSSGQNEALPTVAVTGEAKVGATLSAGAGTGWKGRGPHAFGYQWEACSTVKGKLRCTSLAGETEGTLLVTQAHLGKQLRVIVIGLASDGIGELHESGLTGAVQR